ncbi:MAG: T9SS type A sorting domain-containing protein [Bacteroidales bacterium]|nr:T9SS type A sorting domain-containing protein [Bacteroidales bacterium]
MKHTILFLLYMTTLFWTTNSLFAQQGFVAFGGEATGAGGNLSISGGLIDFEYYSSAQGSLSLGLQHSWDEIASIPPLLEVPNTIVGNGQLLCFNATQTVTIAGDGKQFTVQNGGHADIIAGQNIFLLPGTVVLPGGSLHAYISTEYCDDSESILASAENESYQEFQGFEPERSSNFFSVFPNPTSGNLTLEMTDNKGFSSIRIEIFNAQGNLILTTNEAVAKQYSLSIANKPPGVYLIRVLRDLEIGIQKIIKY